MGLRVVLAARRNIIKCRNQTKAGDLVCGELLNAERREKTPQTRPLHDKLKHASATAPLQKVNVGAGGQVQAPAQCCCSPYS